MACGADCMCRKGMGECATSGPCRSEAPTSLVDRRRFQAAERIAAEVEVRAQEAGLEPGRAKNLARQLGYGALAALESGASARSARRQALRAIAGIGGRFEPRARERPAQPVRRRAKEQVRTAGSVLGGLALLTAGIGTMCWILRRNA